jgi:hypothetical protein
MAGAGRTIIEETGKEGKEKSRKKGTQPPMRKTLVPQLGHMPFFALLPFFIVTDCSFVISTFFLHFTQYACVIGKPPERFETVWLYFDSLLIYIGRTGDGPSAPPRRPRNLFK